MEPLSDAVAAAVTQIELPAGAYGPEPVSVDVRCFVVPYSGGVVLVDTGPPGNQRVIKGALARAGAEWSDVSDVVITHAHFDHVGSLEAAANLAVNATLWAGAADVAQIRLDPPRVIRALADGDRVRDLSVLETPGHTRGHVSLLHEPASVILIGDVVGSIAGTLTFGPPAFTLDAALSRRSLARVASRRPDRVVFSHGAEVVQPLTAIREFLGHRWDSG